MSEQEERRNYLYRLAMALINGDMGIWNSATEEERIEAKEYLNRAGILVPENADRLAAVNPTNPRSPIVVKAKARRTRLSLASKELAID